MTLDPTSPANQIRADLKAAGYKTTQVSVRHHHYSMGSTIHVTIRDEAVDHDEVERIAKGEERISRDEMTGEILCGGNRFVDIHYSSKLESIWAERYAADALAAAAQAEANHRRHFPVGDTAARIYYDDNGYNGLLATIPGRHGRPTMISTGNDGQHAGEVIGRILHQAGLIGVDSATADRLAAEKEAAEMAEWEAAEAKRKADREAAEAQAEEEPAADNVVRGAFVPETDQAAADQAQAEALGADARIAARKTLAGQIRLAEGIDQLLRAIVDAVPDVDRLPEDLAAVILSADRLAEKVVTWRTAAVDRLVASCAG